MVRTFLNGGNLFTKALNWIFGKIQFFENCWHKFHFCQHEIDYTTFTSAFFCWREIILVRKTGKSTCYHKTFEKHSKIRKIKIYMWTVSSLKCSRAYEMNWISFVLYPCWAVSRIWMQLHFFANAHFGCQVTISACSSPQLALISKLPLSLGSRESQSSVEHLK